MGTISQELESFRNNVGSSIFSMNAKKTQILEKVTQLIAFNDEAKQGIDKYYDSSDKSVLETKFTNTNNVLNKISTSINSDLGSMLTESSAIIEKVEKLDSINKEIDALRATINAENNKKQEDRSQTIIDEANASITKNESEFITISNEASSKLKELKAKDENLSFVTEFTITDYTEKLDQLSFGTFTHADKFIASNGAEIDYYIYIPDYGEEVEGLPIHMYLHGSGEIGNNNTLNIGLPKLLNERKITPSGIVICPQSHGKSYDNKAYQDGLIELTNAIAEQYNADKSRISMSGHSWGAIKGYEIISRYPNYFSAFIPISGKSSQQIGYTSTKIWGFHGAKDSNVAYESGANAIKELQKHGVDATLYTYENEAHGNVQNYTFEREFQYTDGEVYNPLEWAYRQTLDKTA